MEQEAAVPVVNLALIYFYLGPPGESELVCIVVYNFSDFPSLHHVINMLSISMHVGLIGFQITEPHHIRCVIIVHRIIHGYIHPPVPVIAIIVIILIPLLRHDKHLLWTPQVSFLPLLFLMVFNELIIHLIGLILLIIIILNLNNILIHIIHVLVHQLIVGLVINHVKVVPAVSLQEYVVVGVVLSVRSALLIEVVVVVWVAEVGEVGIAKDALEGG